MSRTVNCVKLGREAEGLDYAPWPGELGKRIYENISKEAWQLWIQHQTMIINERHLNMLDAEARAFLSEQMERFFDSEDVEGAEGYVPPSNPPA